MEIHITGKNIGLSGEIKDYVREKVEELNRFIPSYEEPERGKSPVEVWVEIGRTTFHHKKGEIFRAEIQLYWTGKSLRAEAQSEDLKSAIIEARDELQREIKTFKGKSGAIFKRKRRFFKKLFNISPLARFKRKKGTRDRLEGN